MASVPEVETAADAAMDCAVAAANGPHSSWVASLASVSCVHPGVTPLMRAAATGSAEVMALLVRLGADPAARDEFGRSALHYAVGGCEWPWHAEGGAVDDGAAAAEAVRAAVELCGPRLTLADLRHSMHRAVMRGRPSVCEALLDARVDPPLARQTLDGSGTALHVLAAGCDEAESPAAVAELLLSRGAPSEALDAYGHTALALVCGVSRGARELRHVLGRWRDGLHPLQLARAEAERCLLARRRDFPVDVAALCGSYVCDSARHADRKSPF